MIRPDGQRVMMAALLLMSWLQAATTSLPNAILLHLQGTLSMSDDEVGWVFSVYIAAGAVTMPLTRWFALRFGRKLVYQTAIAFFAFGLVLAIWAQTPVQFVVARMVEGAAAGPLGPLSLAILLDLLPPPRHGRITLIWSISMILGILSGPSLGGWLGEYHGWQSIFYVGLPISGFVWLTLALFLSEKKAPQVPAFDFFGVATLTLGMIGLQMTMDCGERLEWFDSPVIWASATASVLGFWLFGVHVLTARSHFFDKALLKDRNFVFSSIMFFAFGFVLLPTVALTSPMMDELLGYPSDTTGYLLIPRSIALLTTLILAARAPAWIDNRLLLAIGMALVVYANWRMLGYSPLMDWRIVIAATVFQGAGLGILLPVLGKTAFSTLDPKLRPEANVIFNLARAYGSTLGIAVVLTFFYGNTQGVRGALARDLTPYRAAAHIASTLSKQGLARLDDMITGQAALIGIVGQFKILMFAMLIVSPLALLLRKPRPVNSSPL